MFLFRYLCIYIFTIIYNIYIYTNLLASDVVRLPHHWSGDSQGQETFLAPSADTRTRNYETE